jgi:hypothetical protein
MSARPGRVKAVLEVGLARPRGTEVLRSNLFTERAEQIWDLVRVEAEHAQRAGR